MAQEVRGDFQGKKYHKIKFYTSLKSYDHAELKPGAWEKIQQPIISCTK